MRRDLPVDGAVQGLAFDFTPLVLAWEPLAFPARLPVHGDLTISPANCSERCRPWLDA